MRDLDEKQLRKRTNWIWGAVIAAFVVVFLVVMFNPSGDADTSSPDDQSADVDIMVPAEVPDTPVDRMAAPEDDSIVTRIDDETAAEAATPEE